MPREESLDRAAGLCKVLGNGSRLWLPRLRGQDRSTVGAPTESSGVSQPPVPQYPPTPCPAGLITWNRQDSAVTCALTGAQVANVVVDALVRIKEPAPATGPRRKCKERS